jgi:hypothetical protein
MNLENTFYVLGIIYMVLGFVMMIGLIIAFFYIKAKIDHIQTIVDEKLDQLKNRPGDFAMDIGSAMAASAIKKVKKKLSM